MIVTVCIERKYFRVEVNIATELSLLAPLWCQFIMLDVYLTHPVHVRKTEKIERKRKY